LNRRFALIGYGAISNEIVRCLKACGELDRLFGVLVRPPYLAATRERAGGKFAVVDNAEALLDLGADVVIECAGHDGLRELGPLVLEHGTDLMCSSVGALADSRFAFALASAALSGAQIWIPAGAVAGIDGLLAARTAGLRQVTYTSIKPPAAWNGTPAESRLQGAARERRTEFFHGTAREAATQYPQNANVGATVAFAGLGLDRTVVKLISDPAVSGPLGIIEAEGDFGTFRFEILAYASPSNPKTSIITAHSIVAAVREGACFAVLPQLRG
jgi:aspartate dehydrogenase